MQSGRMRSRSFAQPRPTGHHRCVLLLVKVAGDAKLHSSSTCAYRGRRSTDHTAMRTSRPISAMDSSKHFNSQRQVRRHAWLHLSRLTYCTFIPECVHSCVLRQTGTESATTSRGYSRTSSNVTHSPTHSLQNAVMAQQIFIPDLTTTIVIGQAEASGKVGGRLANPANPPPHTQGRIRRVQAITQPISRSGYSNAYAVSSQ